MTVTLRPLRTDEVAPHLPMLIEDGFSPDLDHGVWIGAFDDAELAGFVRLFTEGGATMLEDVYVLEPHRRRGIATTLIDEARCDIDHLWLICDDEMTGFYEARGFSLAQKRTFPKPLATLYRAKKEWPRGPDHNHNAMLWRRG